MTENTQAPSKEREPPVEPVLYGRHFAWMARLAVRVAKELALTDEQFVKLSEVLINELKKTNASFNRDTFVVQLRTNATSIKQNEGALGRLGGGI
jgi:hypothetical protein